MMDGLNKTAASATLHCLTGCSIGEILGMVASAAFNLSSVWSIVLSIALAFVFGYTLSMRPIVRHGLSFRQAIKIALASDTASIATMEVADNGFVLAVPNAINASLNTSLFWISLGISLVVAFIVAFPVNRFLISKGKGHALVHEFHGRNETHA